MIIVYIRVRKVPQNDRFRCRYRAGYNEITDYKYAELSSCRDDKVLRLD